MANLMGMAEICAKVNRSESTVLNWIRDMDFPAKKVGGIWEATEADITKWKKEQMVVDLGLKNSVRRKKKSRG